MKRNVFTFKKPEYHQTNMYDHYRVPLEQTEDEKLLLKTVVKLKKAAKTEPPVSLIKVLLSLTSHHNVNVLLSVLQILAQIAVVEPIPISLIYPLLDHADMRIQQLTWIVISNAVHNESCRLSLLKLDVFKNMRRSMNSSNDQIIKAVLLSLFHMSYYVAIPNDFLLILEEKGVFSQDVEMRQLGLNIVAQIAISPEIIKDAIDLELVSVFLSSLKDSDGQVVTAALKCILSMTLGNELQVQTLLDLHLMDQLHVLVYQHHTKVVEILINIAHFNKSVVLGFLGKLVPADYELICVLVEDQQIIPQIVNIWLPVLIRELENPLALMAVQQILILGESDKGTPILI